MIRALTELVALTLFVSAVLAWAAILNVGF